MRLAFIQILADAGDRPGERRYKADFDDLRLRAV
jgi:hypothetical protein